MRSLEKGFTWGFLLWCVCFTAFVVITSVINLVEGL